MLLVIVAFITTIAIGPLVFYAMSVHYYKHTRGLRFPATAKGAIGDTLMLPLFNARAVYLLVESNIAFSSNRVLAVALLTLAVSAGYIGYRAYLYPKWYGNNTWMDGHTTLFNFLGWYHVGYFIMQAGVIFYALFSFPRDPWLWIVLFGYVLTAVIGQLQIIRRKI